MSNPSDEELYAWIDQLSVDELRNVIKYMVMLNGDAVQSAMRYVQRTSVTTAPATIVEDQEVVAEEKNRHLH